jgi:hypothetical protein
MLQIISPLTFFKAKFFRIWSTSWLGRISLMIRSNTAFLSPLQSLIGNKNLRETKIRYMICNDQNKRAHKSYFVNTLRLHIHHTHSFRMQKRVLRIMTKSGYRDSYRQLFKNWAMLPFYSQYILWLMLFVVRNTHLYVTNQETHGVNTRHNTDFHFPTVRLTAFKEGEYFMGMKIFNHLPTNTKYYRIG